MKRKISVLALCLLMLIACGPYATEEPAPIITETVTPPPTATNTSPPPIEPQRIEFSAEDGAPLVGYFFPVQAANSPIVVLMHWARGDQTEWTKIRFVDWLTGTAPEKFWTEKPAMPYAVFTFDFRGYGESGGQFDPTGWGMDAKAAYQTAMSLPGVDPARVLGIGSSIGADAVVDACGDLCNGAFSLSPGSYLNVPYSEAVAFFNDPARNPIPIVCIASEEDRESAPACQSASGEMYKSVILPGNVHGTEFLSQTVMRLDVVPPLLEWLANAGR